MVENLSRFGRSDRFIVTHGSEQIEKKKKFLHIVFPERTVQAPSGMESVTHVGITKGNEMVAKSDRAGHPAWRRDPVFTSGPYCRPHTSATASPSCLPTADNLWVVKEASVVLCDNL